MCMLLCFEIIPRFPSYTGIHFWNYFLSTLISEYSILFSFNETVRKEARVQTGLQSSLERRGPTSSRVFSRESVRSLSERKRGSRGDGSCIRLGFSAKPTLLPSLLRLASLKPLAPLIKESEAVNGAL